MAALIRKTNSGWDLVSATFPVEVPIQVGSTQTFTGTFETNTDGYAAVNCGFTPDIIVFDTFTTPYRDGDFLFQDRAVALLNGLSAGAWHETYFAVRDGGDYSGLYTYVARPISNGFELYFGYLGWTFEFYPLSKDMVGTISFTAYKF